MDTDRLPGSLGSRSLGNPSLGTRAAAVGLVLGALGFAGADLLRRLIEPADATPLALVDAVGEHPATWLLAGLMSAATAFLLLPGLAAVTIVVRGRGARTSRVGAVLLGAGALAAIVHAAGYFGTYDVYARGEMGADAVRSIEAASESSPFFTVFIVVFMVGMLLGPLVLAVGLRRARLVPVWGPVAALVFVVAGGTGGIAAGIVGLVAAVAFFGAVARIVARSDAADVVPQAEATSSASTIR